MFSVQNHGSSSLSLLVSYSAIPKFFKNISIKKTLNFIVFSQKLSSLPKKICQAQLTALGRFWKSAFKNPQNVKKMFMFGKLKLISQANLTPNKNIDMMKCQSDKSEPVIPASSQPVFIFVIMFKKVFLDFKYLAY